MVAVITKYRCEHERCGREFPNEPHARECEARHRAVDDTYRLFFEEANKIVPAPYESWASEPPLPALPRPVHICTTSAGWSYWWWKPLSGRAASLGLSGADTPPPVSVAPALDAACDAWLAACKLERSNEFATTLPDGTVSVARYRR